MSYTRLADFVEHAHVSPEHERGAIQQLRYEKWTPMVTNAAEQ